VREILTPFRNQDLNATPPFDRTNPTLARGMDRSQRAGGFVRLSDGSSRGAAASRGTATRS
jgi:hypothetical protein